jgi:peptidoglycan-associated lipoprotein
MLSAIATFDSLEAANAAAAQHESRPHALAPAEAGAQRLAGRLGEPYGPEQRAQELYLDGMEKLKAGRPAWARKTFETLIQQFPHATAAALAHRELDALYRRGAAEAGPAEGAPANSAAAPAVAETVPATGRSPLWEQELRRNASIQAKLRLEAGDRVFFSNGSAELGSRARTALAAQAQWLNRWHEFEAAIEGHADEPGTDDENLKLSLERAEAVRQRLVEEGVEASRLGVVALGRKERIATCQEPDCRAQNRRAVTLVFVSGTRERLGLSQAPSTDASGKPGARPLGPAEAHRPAAAERVGVAR